MCERMSVRGKKEFKVREYIETNEFLTVPIIQISHCQEPQTLPHHWCPHLPAMGAMPRQTMICIQLVSRRWLKISTPLQPMTPTLISISTMKLMFGMQEVFATYLILALSIGQQNMTRGVHKAFKRSSTSTSTSVVSISMWQGSKSLIFVFIHSPDMSSI